MCGEKSGESAMLNVLMMCGAFLILDRSSGSSAGLGHLGDVGRGQRLDIRRAARQPLLRQRLRLALHDLGLVVDHGPAARTEHRRRHVLGQQLRVVAAPRRQHDLLVGGLAQGTHRAKRTQRADRGGRRCRLEDTTPAGQISHSIVAHRTSWYT
jgi:hypothetical protein